MRNIGFIGAGDMAAPMVRYLAKRGHNLWVSERSKTISTELADEFDNVTRVDNQAVVDASDIVFLCLRPAVWQGPVEALSFRTNHKIISVMAGPSMADLLAACAPATSISLTIPMAAMEFGGCPLPVFPESSPMHELFGGDNPVLPQSCEGDITKHFVASTMLSAIFGIMNEGSNWLGAQTGNADSSETYVTALINAMLRDVPHGTGHLLAARDALATPGTLNLAMAEGLEAKAVPEALHRTMDAILAKLERHE
jgi:pyrroline-5-carboxylate reductase